MFLQSNYPQYPPSWQQTRLFSLRNTEALLQLNLHSGWKRTESCLRLHAFRRRLAWLRNRKCQLKHESCLHFNNWCLEMLRVFEKWKLESALTFPSMSSNLRSETGSGSSEIWELGKEKSFLRRGMIVPISKILRSYQIHATRKVGQLQTKFI